MSAQSFARQLREIIEGVKEKGTAAIHCDTLIAYLKDVEKSPDPELTELEKEQYKANLQNWINQNDHKHQANLEMFRSVIMAGQSAIKSSFLLNGGAAVALLAFIGHLAEFVPSRVPVLSASLLPFAYGVLSISITSGFTYLSQWLYGSDTEGTIKWGFRVNIFCIVLGLSSYAFFLWGLFSVFSVLSKF